MRSIAIVCGIVALVVCSFALEYRDFIDNKDSISLDIHMKVSHQTATFVEQYLSPVVDQLLPHNDINFTRTIPHITLYMTMFKKENIDNLLVAFQRTAKALLETYPDCNLTMMKAAASGEYYLWHSNIPPCLQSMSDSFVNSLSQYRDLNQKIPKWLDEMPEPQRSEMIKLQTLYGSPVVMSYFDPHVTVAWDDQESMAPLDKLEFPLYNMTTGDPYKV